MTKEIESDECLKVPHDADVEITRDGVQVINNNRSGDKSTQETNLYPINEAHSWLENFYELVWANELQDRLNLLIQVLVKEQDNTMKSIGYFVHDLVD